MTRNAFIVLMLATVGAIFLGATIAERYTDEGLGRTLMVGAIAAAVVIPLSLLLEKIGWIKGRFEPFKRPEPLDGGNAEPRGGDSQ
jgi:hypothetical protein